MQKILSTSVTSCDSFSAEYVKKRALGIPTYPNLDRVV